MQLDFLLVHYPLKKSINLKKDQTKTNFQMVLTLYSGLIKKFKYKLSDVIIFKHIET